VVGVLLAAALALPLALSSAADSGAEKAGQVVGVLVTVFGLPTLLRYLYVRLRRGGRPLRSGWIVVMALTLAGLARVGNTQSDAATTGNPFGSVASSAVVVFVPLDAHANALLRSTVPALAARLPPHQQLAVSPVRGGLVRPVPRRDGLSPREP
jgi:hypothetical protein